mgnify:FL=1
MIINNTTGAVQSGNATWDYAHLKDGVMEPAVLIKAVNSLRLCNLNLSMIVLKQKNQKLCSTLKVSHE